MIISSDMTPKEKAQQLYDLFYFVDTHDGYGQYDRELTHEDRKECVKILVKQIINVLVFTDMSTMVGRFCERHRSYYEKVINELDNIERDWL
jgi:23S rRNA A2030 N6-methylase RlmJ